MKRLLFFISVCTFFIGYSQSYTFSGKVVDELNEPIYAANVVVDAIKGLGTQTDFDGNFSIQLEAGKYTVAVSYLGKETLTKEIILNKDSRSHLFVLSPSNVEIEIVTVTAGKYEKKFGEETVSMDVLPTNLIENNVAQPQDALNKIPGYQNIGESPSIRGGGGFASGASSRTLFLIDGIPQLSPENGGIFFETLPLENLKQVEVIKGAASSLYGSSALNGIINFRTAWPSKV